MLFVVYVVIYIVSCCDATCRMTVAYSYRQTFVGAVWLLSMYVLLFFRCLCCRCSLCLLSDVPVPWCGAHVYPSNVRGTRRQRDPKSAPSTLP